LRLLTGTGLICDNARFTKGGLDVELTEAQRHVVEQWVNEGSGLSEIQNRLSQEFGITLTYMDVRFLIINLGLKVRDKSRSSFPETHIDGSPVAGQSGGRAQTDQGGLPSPPSGIAGVSVEVERIASPGSIVSGTVTFSDGVSAVWSLDQLGRLALEPGKPGYTPSEQDLQAFQQELKSTLANRGF